MKLTEKQIKRNERINNYSKKCFADFSNDILQGVLDGKAEMTKLYDENIPFILARTKLLINVCPCIDVLNRNIRFELKRREQKVA